MKKAKTLLTLDIAVAALSSCVPKTYYNTIVGYIDYASFADEGMYLTESNSTSFDYTPLGSVSATVLSGHVEKTRPGRYDYTDVYGKRPNEKYKEWITATPEQAIKLAV